MNWFERPTVAGDRGAMYSSIPLRSHPDPRRSGDLAEPPETLAVVVPHRGRGSRPSPARGWRVRRTAARRSCRNSGSRSSTVPCQLAAMLPARFESSAGRRRAPAGRRRGGRSATRRSRSDRHRRRRWRDRVRHQAAAGSRVLRDAHATASPPCDVCAGTRRPPSRAKPTGAPRDPRSAVHHCDDDGLTGLATQHRLRLPLGDDRDRQQRSQFEHLGPRS